MTSQHTPPRLFTIGYATKPIATFVDQLKKYQITALADVRSVPYSRTFHDFNRETLIRHLTSNQIKYVYLGEELGPRSKNPDHYNARGQVQFSRLMDSDLFKQGIKRLMEGNAKGYKIAMMCAEKDPAVCHRSLLISYALRHRNNVETLHITHSGELESQTRLEQRLLELTDTHPDIFTDEQACLDLAYEKFTLEKAYIKPGESR